MSIHAQPAGRVQAGTLQITGSAGSDTIALRLQPGVPTTLQVDLDGDGTADASFDSATFTAINVEAGSGADTITGSNGLAPLGRLTIDGGRGNDTLLGGDGDDVLSGGEGNDTVNGNRGNDVALLGSGSDRFVWNPSDGNDTVEGQAGKDVLGFNGSNAAEQMDVAPNGTRLRPFRNVRAVTMDLDGVERLAVNALADADEITVQDLAGTDLKGVDLDLSASGGGGHAQADTVNVSGTNRADRVQVTRSGAETVEKHLAAGYRKLGVNTRADLAAELAG